MTDNEQAEPTSPRRSRRGWNRIFVVLTVLWAMFVFVLVTISAGFDEGWSIRGWGETSRMIRRGQQEILQKTLFIHSRSFDADAPEALRGKVLELKIWELRSPLQRHRRVPDYMLSDAPIWSADLRERVTKVVPDHTRLKAMRYYLGLWALLLVRDPVCPAVRCAVVCLRSGRFDLGRVAVCFALDSGRVPLDPTQIWLRIGNYRPFRKAMIGQRGVFSMILGWRSAVIAAGSN